HAQVADPIRSLRSRPRHPCGGMDRCGPLVGTGARRDPYHPTGDRDLVIDQKGERILRFRPGRDGAPLPEAEGFTWYEWGNPLELVGIRLDPGGVLVLIDGDGRFVLGS